MLYLDLWVIGKSLLNIVKNKKDFEIILLTANKNYKELFNQTKNITLRML